MKKFIILILAGLLLPAFCLGAVSYSRTPSGYTISNPVSFNVEFDTWEESGCFLNSPETNKWSLFLTYYSDNNYEYSSSDLLATTTLIYNFNEELPLGGYLKVWQRCYLNDEAIGNGEQLEYSEIGGNIFEVVEEEEPAPPTGGIWTLPADFLASTTAYVGDIFGDIWVLVALMIGFPLAFWVILKIENLVKNKDKTKFKRPKDLKEKNNWL